jgi:hypothetical protein
MTATTDTPLTFAEAEIRVASWMVEQRRVDAAYLRLVCTIAKGFTSADPVEMSARYPETWPTPAEAAADIDLVGWKFRLARPNDKAAGAAPIHYTFVTDAGRQHVWYFEGLNTFADQDYTPIDNAAPTTIKNIVGYAGSLTLPP